jgi:hypothetical protein
LLGASPFPIFDLPHHIGLRPEFMR